MTKLKILGSSRISLAVVAAIAQLLSGQAYAQSAEDDEALVAPIELDNRLPEDDGVAPEDEFEDLIFDADTVSYRLVEDDSGDDWMEPPPQSEQDSAELKRLFELYRDALANKNYVEADTLAKRVVELSIQLNGLDSHDSAKAITNLGIAQHNNKDYEAAQLNFTASINIIERIDDRLSIALVNPLQGLAATQAATGRPDLATRSYQRAIHVTHVNDGPHNAGQVDSLESMAELYISMGEIKDASSIQQNIFSIQSRNIDPTSLDIIPAMEKRAEWQHRLQFYDNERATWRRLIQILEKHHGNKSLELVEPLKKLGRSYLFVSLAEYDFQTDVSTASGETYLRRANRIADENPDSNWEIVEDTLLSLGDYYILSGRPNQAARVYLEAWAVLSDGEEEDRLVIRKDHLEEPHILQRVYPARYYNSLREDDGNQPPGNFETGSIVFGYSVGANGRINNLIHLETQPAEIEDFAQPVARSLRRLIYRPRLEDGRPVSTHEFVYTHEFFYRPPDIKEKVEALEPAANEDDEKGDETSTPMLNESIEGLTTEQPESANEEVT